MSIEPEQALLALGVAAALSFVRVPLAAATFFAGVFLLELNAQPLPQGFLLDYSLALRLNSPALVSMPLFALAGEMAVAAGIGERLLNLADACAERFGFTAGGRAVFGCSLFASVSGVGTAAVKAEGRRLIDGLRTAGFGRNTAAGLVAVAASLGIIIPTSMPQTVFAAAAGVNTNIIFTAAFVPGILTATALAGAAALYSRFRSGAGDDVPEEAAIGDDEAQGFALHGNISMRSAPSLSAAFRQAVWALLLPIAALSGLFTGFFTAPEAAAFSSAYAAAVGVLAHNKLRRGDLFPIIARAALSASAILLLVGVGGLFLTLLDVGGISGRLADVLYAWAGGRVGAILLLNLLLLAAGCLLDVPANIALVVPLLLPLAAKCGLPVFQFGAMAAINLAIGLVTPPQALNSAAAAYLTGVHPGKVAMAAWPFLLVMLACLGAVSFIPILALWLPRTFGWV